MRKAFILLFLMSASAAFPVMAGGIDGKLDVFRKFLVDYRKARHIPSFSVALAKDGKIG